MNLVRVGERFGGEFCLSQQEILEFARAVGDLNPVHHDAEAARKTRFGRIIASGPQPASIFMALTATYFSRTTAMLGLEFNLKFQKPVFADEPYRMEWVVQGVEFKEKLRGELVSLAGTVISPAGEVVLSGTGTILVTDKL
ncbi:MaoC family dehydratase [uncultured Meiothermus sp.]|jgi:acyl dehydratase|uniref:MaoC family dehydratase n=1 Tax=uncultured Meiothermus sp. TaxID=157471 RepID=UPI002626F914|nr:MaoC family dehydratase [uncultured Meiothermus sp.]